ncbi:MAG: sensor histidine kinase [Solirubrobacteraceae bacterium]
MEIERAAVSFDEARFRALLDAGRAVVAETDFAAISTTLLRVARELTGARFAALGVLDDTRDGLAEFVTLGLDDTTRAAIGAPPHGRGLLGVLIARPEPVRVADVSEHPLSYGFPPGHPPMRTFLGVPVMIRGEVWGSLWVTEKAGGAEFDEDDEEAAVVLADWAGIAIDRERVVSDGVRHRRALERTVNALHTTIAITRAIESEAAPDRILELIAQRSRALVDARRVLILLHDGADLVVGACAGELEGVSLGARVPIAGSHAARVLATAQTERIEQRSSMQSPALVALGIDASAALLVPLRFRGASVGVIEALDRIDGPSFSEEDEQLLEAAAASAAAAIATAQSVERQRLRRAQRTADDERRRWAERLRDEPLQSLGALRMTLASGLRADDAGLRTAVSDAIGQLQEDIEGLRELISSLRPSALDDLGFYAALDALCDRFREAHGLAIEVLVKPSDHSGLLTVGERETILYRVVQEALGHAANHGGAERVLIELDDREEELHLVVHDDGGRGHEGVVPAFGLSGIRERIALLDGRLAIDHAPQGTTTWVVLPGPRR